MYMKFVIVAILVVLAFVNAAPAGPPTDKTKAQLARHVMHSVDWISLGTLSTTDEIKGYPMVNVWSTADGNTGIPYLFITDLDMSGQDINSDSRSTIMATLADGECAEKELNAQDPRCPKLVLTGRVVKVADGEELKFAKKALFDKHPIMAYWEQVHNFYVVKMEIERVMYLGWFGGPNIIDPSEYLNAEV